MRWPGGGSADGGTRRRGRGAGAASARIGVEIETALGEIGQTRRAARRGRRCSPACTRPRWRSGSAIAGSRGSAPSTGMPSAAIASRDQPRWRSLPTRLSTTPAMRTAGSWRGKAARHRRRRLRLAARRRARADRQPEARGEIGGGAAAAGGAAARRRTGPSRLRSRTRSAPAAACASERVEQRRRHRPAVEIDARARRSPPRGRPGRCSPARFRRAHRPGRAGASAAQERRASPWSCRSPSAARATIRPRARHASAHRGTPHAAAGEQALARMRRSRRSTMIAGEREPLARAASAASSPSVVTSTRCLGVVAGDHRCRRLGRQPAARSARRRSARDSCIAM